MNLNIHNYVFTENKKKLNDSLLIKQLTWGVECHLYHYFAHLISA